MTTLEPANVFTHLIDSTIKPTTMKDQQARIAAAIAAYLEENTFLNDSDIYAPEITFGIVKEYPTPTHTECCKELADQIAAAIAPHLEAGSGIQGQEVDRDEFYTEKFKEWREKYFTPDGGKRRFTSKSNGVLYDDFGLQEKFKRAYNLSPIK